MTGHPDQAPEHSDQAPEHSDEQLDHSPGDGWSCRRVALHMAESAYYADAVGKLS